MRRKNSIKRTSWLSWVIFGVLMLDAILLIFLYSWSFFTSVKTTDGFLKNMLLPTLPWEWDFSNYQKSFELFQKIVVKPDGIYSIGITDMAYNSIKFCIITTTIGSCTQWMMAYLIGRFKWKFNDYFYKFMVVIMMIPIMGGLPISLKLYKSLNLYDTFWQPAIGSIGFGGMSFLILHSFIRNVGMETIEAAKIDGAGNLTIMLGIVFPQTINIFLLGYLTSFIGHWNDYMTMVVWLPSHPSLAYGVYSFSTSSATGAGLPPIQMAGAMILALPMFTLFVIFKDKLIGGISVSVTK